MRQEGACKAAFAAALLFAAVAGMAAASGIAGEPSSLSVTQIQPGVFVHRGKLEDWGPANGGDVANLGFVVGSRCVAVIDTGGTPAIGAALRAAIGRVTALPVCWVIDTHAHPDHLLGNTAFAAARDGAAPPKFIAAAAFTRTLAAREPYYLNALHRDFGIMLTHSDIVYPTVSVSVGQVLDIDLGDRVLSLRAWPTAHTDNDLTVYDHRTRTLFASDLLFVSHLPALDGSLRGWITVLGELRSFDVATVVPGHGPVSNDWPAVLQPEIDYLSALLRETRAAIAKGWTLSEAVERIGVAAGEDWRLTERFHRRNVTAAYAELEWEDDAPHAKQAPPAATN